MPHRREAICPLAERTLHATANRGSIQGRAQIGTRAFSFDHLVSKSRAVSTVQCSRSKRMNCEGAPLVQCASCTLRPFEVAPWRVRYLLWTAVHCRPSAQDKASWQGQTSTLVDGSSHLGSAGPMLRWVIFDRGAGLRRPAHFRFAPKS